MSHSRMIGKVIAMEPARVPDLARRRQAPTGTLAELGAASCSPTLGCATCHMDDGTGPRPVAARRLRQSQVTLANGEKVTADEAYLRESILTPTGEDGGRAIQPLMPTFQGVVSEEQIAPAHRLHQVARRHAGRATAPAPAAHGRRRPRAPRRHGHARVTREPIMEASIAKPTNYLNATHGAASWFLTKDHKRIALLYLYRRLGLLPGRRHLRDARSGWSC